MNWLKKIMPRRWLDALREDLDKAKCGYDSTLTFTLADELKHRTASARKNLPEKTAIHVSQQAITAADSGMCYTEYFCSDLTSDERDAVIAILKRSGLQARVNQRNNILAEWE